MMASHRYAPDALVLSSRCSAPAGTLAARAVCRASRPVATNAGLGVLRCLPGGAETGPLWDTHHAAQPGKGDIAAGETGEKEGPCHAGQYFKRLLCIRAGVRLARQQGHSNDAEQHERQHRSHGPGRRTANLAVAATDYRTDRCLSRVARRRGSNAAASTRMRTTATASRADMATSV
jgi:hypothetical protein